jgi:hypothetical protein
MIAPAMARLIADAVTRVAAWRRSITVDLARLEEKRHVTEPQMV